ncbi:MAG: putative molybdenum carrier protein [Thermoguttaceae bacterium]
MTTEPESPGQDGPVLIDRIVSGGQTGVDRAGLDVAIELGIGHGGWCPKGRRAEDGRIPDCYALAETVSEEYSERTERNVVDSDGTLILYLRTLRGGTELTYRLAKKHGKPSCLVDLSDPVPASAVQQWIREKSIRVLNVAGPRASQNGGIYELARAYLLTAVASP